MQVLTFSPLGLQMVITGCTATLRPPSFRTFGGVSLSSFVKIKLTQSIMKLVSF